MLRYVAHDAEMRRTLPDGTSQRALWVASAKQGNRDAQRKLRAPRFPIALGYLYEWVGELHGRSGVGMDGVAPLTYQTIGEWSRLTGRTIEPHEVQALLAIDSELCRLGRVSVKASETVTSGEIVRPKTLTPAPAAWPSASPPTGSDDA